MSVSALTARVAALEEQLNDVNAVNADLRADVDALVARFDEMGAGSAKKVKEKKETTNKEGPKTWNGEIDEVWRDMAIAAGMDASLYVPMGEDGRNTFKKAAAKAGATFQMAQQRASHLRAEREGKTCDCADCTGIAPRKPGRKGAKKEGASAATSSSTSSAVARKSS
jgi:hypothetical protein